jgi:transcriptional regulator with XRE-family HTH domain
VSRDKQLAAFGREVRRAREAKGMSKAELARRIGVRPSAVTQWEAGETGARGHTIAKLEEVLDRPGQLGWIIGYGSPPAVSSIEAAIEADGTLTDKEKRAVIALLAELRAGRKEEQ